MNEVYMNFSDIDSKPPTGCIKQGLFVLVPKETIFIVSVLSTYHTLRKVIFLFLRRQGENWLCIFTYCHFNCFTRENQFPSIYRNGSKICKV